MEELNAFHLTRYVEGKRDFEPLSDRAKAICKRLTDKANQTDGFLDYDLLMTAVEVIMELEKRCEICFDGWRFLAVEKAIREMRSGDGLTPDEPLNGNRGDAP